MRLRAEIQKMFSHYRWQKCSPGTLLSGGIRFTRMFAGVPWQGGLKRQGGSPKCILVISSAYIFGTFRAKDNITTQRHEVLYRLSNELKMLDLE